MLKSLKLLIKYEHNQAINSFQNELQITAVLRTLSSSLLTGRAGRLRLPQITPAQKNPELFRDFQPTPGLRGLLFLYKGIISGTGEVRT